LRLQPVRQTLFDFVHRADCLCFLFGGQRQQFFSGQTVTLDHFSQRAIAEACFRHSLVGVITVSEQKTSEKTQAQILRDAFEGMKGRQPKADRKLNERLASDE
jgi:hypothetical protein